MKRKNLTHLMVTGITSGLFVLSFSSHALANQDPEFSKWIEKIESTDGNITFKAFTDEDLLLQLNESTAALYRSLSPEGKALAREIASRSCNGTNTCKGTNACRTDKNACLGQGPCKGLSKCSISDKNLAVKLAAKVMAKKRAALQQPSTPTETTK